MAFFFVVGTKDFTKPLPGHEGITAQCHNCGNWAAHPIQSWDWFTFCWVPIIPLGSKHKDLACSICRFRQDLRNRPDVGSQQGQGSMMPQQGPPQGWTNPPPHASGGMPPGPQQPHYK